ncbi:Major facilitator superfamily domain general substrate transporter [Penicillium robsamsonii]|uniref:Major facilitator superfamily domain general substrate transporter n=1 Tax=Penicillium robsamsonii TaxID=1792511 RepID=UPI0025470B4B|nr:Major facilitator superfamily domain general substrate transporter [Penicillium robsamsonii]KAJ5827173.1 Major facilitator superfamily domain general substrate transporter [Penicillium robsamsonii]
MAKDATPSRQSELEFENANELPIVTPSNVDDSHLLTGKKLCIAFSAMLLALLLIALDQTILSTALPRIASDFNAFTQQGWVATSFVLTQTAFILFFSQVLRVYPAKYVLIASVVIFEVGSALSGAAQDVNTLIGGRALSGVGAAGILTGILQVMAQATRLEDRPTLFSFFESVFALASIIGPLIGGALTDHVTWRWCFYINLPIGGVSIVAITLLLDAPPPLGSEGYDGSPRTMLRRTSALDWIGAILSLGAITSLVLGLQWGGNEKAWSSADVIICLVLAFVLTVAFIFWERYMGDRAMVPLAIFKSGLPIYSICSFAIFNRFIYLIFTYYIPIYYQAGRHHSAIKSGVDLLPLMLSVVISIVVSGQIVGYTGRYWPWLVGGPIFGAVGAGLMYTVTASASNGALIGYQILVGICIGTTLQNILFAMQAEFNDTPKLISQATGMVNFCQFLGGTIGLAIAEAIFSSELVHNLRKYAPDAPFAVIEQSPLSIYSAVPDALVPNVVRAYVKSLSIVYVIGVPASGLSLVFALFISNINMKRKPETDTENNVPDDDNVARAGNNPDGQPPITEKRRSSQTS